MNHDRTTCSTRRNNELEISYQTCVGKGRRLALCIWNEVFTGLPAGNDMQRQNDLRREIIPSWRSPSKLPFLKNFSFCFSNRNTFVM